MWGLYSTAQNTWHVVKCCKWWSLIIKKKWYKSMPTTPNVLKQSCKTSGAFFILRDWLNQAENLFRLCVPKVTCHCVESCGVMSFSYDTYGNHFFFFSTILNFSCGIKSRSALSQCIVAAGVPMCRNDQVFYFKCDLECRHILRNPRAQIWPQITHLLSPRSNTCTGMHGGTPTCFWCLCQKTRKSVKQGLKHVATCLLGTRDCCKINDTTPGRRVGQQCEAICWVSLGRNFLIHCEESIEFIVLQ